MPDDPSQGKDSSWKPTAAKQKLVSEYPAKFKEWTKDDNYVKQVITASIPESITTVTPNQPCTTEATQGWYQGQTTTQGSEGKGRGRTRLA